jgi:hypothetical protein
MPDEVPAEGVAIGVVLRLQILGAVFSQNLDAGLGEVGQTLDRDVLRRCDDRDGGADLFADLLVPLADLSRRRRRSPPAGP